MRRLLLLLVVALSGCTCGRKQESGQSPPAPSASTSGPSFDLALHHDALMAFGNAIPLPLSNAFDEEVPAVRPALERAAKAQPDKPLPLRISRDVPFGQLTRLTQAAVAYRVSSWLLIDDANVTRSVVIAAPGALPSGRCFARIWVSPDAAVHVGFDPGAEAGTMLGVVVRPRDGGVQAPKVIGVLRRLDPGCSEGQLRLYTQPTARIGPVLDLALAVAAAPPKVGSLMLGVPSIGPLDTPVEVVP